jgi:hypothetical protein
LDEQEVGHRPFVGAPRVLQASREVRDVGGALIWVGEIDKLGDALEDGGSFFQIDGCRVNVRRE